ncbi:MAG TPA: beta-ketoacyl-ACP synthase II [Anaerolineae bacterium]|nr:beta-ketoacyl-ACP synthase II [Anaerolineae bacterium]
MNNSHTRIVITGLGAISALGLTVDELWTGLVAGRSGIGRITQFDPSSLPCQIAGEVKNFDPKQYMEAKEARRMARCSQFVIAATQAAMKDAGFDSIFTEPERAGVVLGTGIGGVEKIGEALEVHRQRGWTKLNPFLLPAMLGNLPGHYISKVYQALGPLNTVVTACAAGTQAIGEAAELIRRGLADVVITGGVEAAIQDYLVACFCAMRALPLNYNDRPELASRPFDLQREGFIFAEGCGILILESLEHAQRRGARIHAEVLGHAASSDAYDIAQPEPSGNGAARAIRWALQDAGITPDQVSYINAHGTSTAANDSGETHAIKQVFGEHAYSTPISSTKSMIGHGLGAAGALEAIVCVQTLRHNLIHPTINYTTPDPECDLDYVPNLPRSTPVNVTLSNSFGLGGQNACLVLGKFDANKAG